MPLSDTGSNLTLIVGHYKSGSSWLVNMLSLHPDIIGVTETHVVRYAHESKDLPTCTETLYTKLPWAEGGQKKVLRRRLADLVGPYLFWRPRRIAAREKPTTMHDLNLRDQNQFREYLNSSSSPDEYVRRFFSFLYDRLRPNKYLIEKTPTNIFEVPRIRRVFPEAKLIAVYRDGRDVAVSDKHHRRNMGEGGYTLEDSIKKWRRAMEAHLEYTAKYDILSFSYETMLGEPEQTVRRLLQFLGLPEAPAIVQDLVKRSSFEFTTGRKRGKEDPNNFYRKGIAGDWVKSLTDEEKAYFSDKAGDLLVRLGYEESADWHDWGKVKVGEGVAPS
jgi:hypothetical protein